MVLVWKLNLPEVQVGSALHSYMLQKVTPAQSTAKGTQISARPGGGNALRARADDAAVPTDNQLVSWRQSQCFTLWSYPSPDIWMDQSRKGRYDLSFHDLCPPWRVSSIHLTRGRAAKRVTKHIPDADDRLVAKQSSITSMNVQRSRRDCESIGTERNRSMPLKDCFARPIDPHPQRHHDCTSFGVALIDIGVYTCATWFRTLATKQHSRRRSTHWPDQHRQIIHVR